MPKEYVMDKTCKERTSNILEKIKEIKGNDLVHLNTKIDNLDSKFEAFKGSMDEKLNYVIIIGIVLSLLAGINVLNLILKVV
jgi:hypothetical protein